jgi:penicillin amidase
MLGALAIDRAQSWTEFRRALQWWKAPSATFAYADRDGVVALHAAGLEPRRQGWDGRLPAPGWTGTFEWRGWLPVDSQAAITNPSNGVVVDANRNVPRTSRIREVIGDAGTFGAAASAGLQHDVHAWTADRLLARLARLRPDDAEVEQARQRLIAWNRELTTGSPEATLYVLWEQAIERQRAEAVLDQRLARELVAQRLAPPLASDPSVDAYLLPALASAVKSYAALTDKHWRASHTLTFEHPLALGDAGRRRFDVGPFRVPGYQDTVMAAWGEDLGVTDAAAFRQVVDLSDWDRATVINAPGQSESPDSPHYADLATIWAAGGSFPLPFTDTAINANAGAVLRIVPKR